MKQVIHVTRKRDLKTERMAVLRLELDYELAVLFEAMEEKDTHRVGEAKEKLFTIRQEILDINGKIS
ncbi:hypothetical protein [Jeotgalibacillus soli]|uniref:Uncharacterized protein n=1 Tax=Jeotgalibacillus soli TaxID=889306 RepID=A0A0C2V6Z2_9BACL|nr:hypothetical protein [Jeotgalibacillus soli]KIL44732.1 hypothetical protein KP78_22760 [Jeotgalibacillus soli]